MQVLFRVIPVVLVLAASAALAAPLALKVAAALAAFDATGAAVVNVRLEPESAQSFTAFTAANVGKRVELRVDGEIVTAPIIRDPITGGEIVISGSMTAEDAGRLAMRLRDGALIEVDVAAE